MRGFESLRVVGLLVGLSLAACGPGGGGDDSSEDEAVLEVRPATATLTVSNGVAVEQPYTAHLVFPDGSERDVTDEAVFVLAEGFVGFFEAETLVANGAGRGLVRATRDGKMGDATVEVFARDVRVPDGVPPNAPDLFDAATDDPARLATIIYPSDGTIVPPNLGDFDVHWSDATGSDLFEIELATYYANVKVYAAGNAAAGAWLAFLLEEWTLIAQSEVGATINVTVRGLTQAAPQTSSHAAIVVRNSREDIQGGIYYWAATNTAGVDGIFRHDVGRPGQAAEQFYTRTEAGRCVACHALSRDGTKMAITYDGGDGPANIVDVATRTTMVPADSAWNFATFSPDGDRLLTVRSGVLTLRDGSTAAAIATVPTSGYASHPDFSPQGDRIVYVRPTSPTGYDWHFQGGAIVTQTYGAGDAFGGEVEVVPSSPNNYYPSLSPDGEWVLFNRSTEDAYDDGSAELWVVKIDGSVGPIRLDLANIGPGLTNSWARWAPFEGTYGEDAEPIYWLTFSSKRAFGVRLAAGRPQIWMTPFFPERAAAGTDPTAPGFRLPFQDLASSNHIAQWTETVVPVE
jgi:dipeptidyl aminopeptidase/acylaminoacyl peptidase